MNNATTEQPCTIATLYVAGDGEWCKTTGKAVRITHVMISAMINGDEDDEREYAFVTIEVLFNTDDWNVEVDGLIYTDSGFLDELGHFFATKGVDVSGLEYTEHGMQGYNSVSLEADDEFIRTAIENLPPEWITIVEYEAITYTNN